MKNRFTAFAVGSALAALILMGAPLALVHADTTDSSTVSNGGDEGSTGTPGTGGTSTSGSTGSTSNGGDDGVTAPPSTGNSYYPHGPSNTSNGGDDVSQPSSGGNGGNGGSGSSGGGSATVGGGGGFAFAASTTTASTSLTSTCPLITTPLKQGGDNSPLEVTKLQAFLKNSEHADVDVNGIFDDKTLAAVIAFQRTYLPTVMGPWGATRPSGFVYITTIKMINELACKAQLTLSPEELAVIDAYKVRLASREVEVSNTVSVTPGINTNIPAFTGGNSTTSSSSANSDVSLAGQNDNEATVAQASILARFWAFVLSLFR